MKQLTPEVLEKRKKINKRILMIFLPVILLLFGIGIFGSNSPSSQANRYPVTASFGGANIKTIKQVCLDDIADANNKTKIKTTEYGDSIIMFDWSSFGSGTKAENMKMKFTLAPEASGVKMTSSSDWNDTLARVVNEGWIQTIQSRYNKTK